MIRLIIYKILLLAVSFWTFTCHAYFNGASDQTANSDKVYSQLESKLSQLELNLEESYIVKSQINHQLTLFRNCERDAQDELNTVNKLNLSNKDKEPASSLNKESNHIQLKLAQLETQLFECRYWLLKFNQLKDIIFEIESKRQFSNYLKSSDLYWDAEADENGSLPVKLISQVTALIGHFISIFFINALIFYSLKQKPSMQAITCILTTFVTSAIATVVLKSIFKPNVDWLWLTLITLLIPYAILNYSSYRLKLINCIKLSLLAILSTIFISDSLLPTNKLIHALLFLTWLILLGSCFLNTFEQIKLKSILTVSVIVSALEFSDFHNGSHQLLLVLFCILVLKYIYWHILLIVNAIKLLLNSLNKKLIEKFKVKIPASMASSPPGLIWLEFTLKFALLILATIVMLPYLGFSAPFIERLTEQIGEGFNLGTIQINIRDILIAMLVFGSLLYLSWILKLKIEYRASTKAVVQTSHFAKATLFWYSAILTNSLIALSIIGISVANLALIAGAFSIGIGFGLQNIVSNFVSGLILLIEQPVKPGDWVIVGSTEGFIQKINIRATQVKTFDRADILIPNTELISNQVTNLMLGDSIGRLRFSVGVAYGNKPKLVQQTLLDILHKMPGVISDKEEFYPSVVFKNFGDSALEFEVRCFLNDIQEIIHIKSNLLFEVEEQFRQKGIQIPFPQRDIHIKTNPLNHGLDNEN